MVKPRPSIWASSIRVETPKHPPIISRQSTTEPKSHRHAPGRVVEYLAPQQDEPRRRQHLPDDQPRQAGQEAGQQEERTRRDEADAQRQGAHPAQGFIRRVLFHHPSPRFHSPQEKRAERRCPARRRDTRRNRHPRGHPWKHPAFWPDGGLSPARRRRR